MNAAAVMFSLACVRRGGQTFGRIGKIHIDHVCWYALQAKIRITEHICVCVCLFFTQKIATCAQAHSTYETHRNQHGIKKVSREIMSTPSSTHASHVISPNRARPTLSAQITTAPIEVAKKKKQICILLFVCATR